MLLPADRLASTFGLTSAKAKLAAALATGTSLSDYADAAQITIGTARWYLKQALAKTGAHRQSELVRHVITAVGAGAAEQARLERMCSYHMGAGDVSARFYATHVRCIS